jgi:hypothetical protein
MSVIILTGCHYSASAAVVIRLPYIHLIASDDFLYDTVDVAIWSTVEQCLAITAGGLATLQPLVKLIGYKLGLSARPTIPGPSGYGNNIHMTAGSIAVKRSVTRRTEVRTSAHNKFNQTGLKLHPGVAEYSAECYNTSQELLRVPTTGSDRKPSKDVEGGGQTP